MGEISHWDTKLKEAGFDDKQRSAFLDIFMNINVKVIGLAARQIYCEKCGLVYYKNIAEKQITQCSVCKSDLIR